LIEIDEPVRVKNIQGEVRESYLEIFELSSHRLVTGLEFLSPANKRKSPGRKLYQKKQRELADANVNLVEIDLLRAGRHVLAVPEAIAEELQPWEYLVNLVRPSREVYEF